MSDDDADRESEEQDAQPELGDDDYVDVPDDVAEEVAAADADPSDEGDEGGAESAQDDTDDAEEPDTQQDTADPLTTGTTVGDVYCNALGMGATLARDRKGSGVDNRERKSDEYADMARQLDLDTFVDEWVQAHGGSDDLSPGQGIAVGTAMFMMAVMVDDPDLADGLAEEVSSA